MVNSWKDILTKKQKEQLIKKTTEALEKLVSSPEIKDLLEDIYISRKNYHRTDYEKIYLTVEGLEERSCCKGHRFSNWEGLPDYYEHCKERRKNVPMENFQKIVEDYKLTPTVISKIETMLSK